MAPGVRLSWAASWPCGDRAGVLAAPAGVVVIAVEGIVLRARRGGAPRVLRVGVLLWSMPRPRSRVAPMPVEGFVGEKVHRVVRGVGSTVAGAVLGTFTQGVAGSHCGATVPRMAEQ